MATTDATVDVRAEMAATVHALASADDASGVFAALERAPPVPLWWLRDHDAEWPPLASPPMSPPSHTPTIVLHGRPLAGPQDDASLARQLSEGRSELCKRLLDNDAAVADFLRKCVIAARSCSGLLWRAVDNVLSATHHVSAATLDPATCAIQTVHFQIDSGPCQQDGDAEVWVGGLRCVVTVTAAIPLVGAATVDGADSTADPPSSDDLGDAQLPTHAVVTMVDRHCLLSSLFQSAYAPVYSVGSGRTFTVRTSSVASAAAPESATARKE